VVARVLHEERFGLYASPDYLKSQGTPDSVEALEAAQWTLLTQSHPDDVVRLRRDDQTVEIRPRVFNRCNSPLMLQHLVLQGHGIGALLPGVMRPEIEAGLLVPVMPELTSDPMVVSLMYRSRKQLPERTRAVVDYLMAECLFQRPERK